METNGKRTLRNALRFWIAAAAVQLLVSLVWSAPALERVFPLYVRAVSESVTLGDRSYTEYYAIRRRVTESPVQLIVVGVDFDYVESYALLSDLFTSLKNDVNIGTVLIDNHSVASSVSADVITAADAEARNAALEELRAIRDVPSCYVDFLTDLSESKDDYPPSRRYVGGSFHVAENGSTYAEMLCETARAYYNTTARPVLAVIDTAYLQTEAGMREYLEANLPDSLCIQCRYESKKSRIGASAGEIRVVDCTALATFDDLYAQAVLGADGRYSSERYSKWYSTDVFFTLYNCTAAE